MRSKIEGGGSFSESSSLSMSSSSIRSASGRYDSGAEGGLYTPNPQSYPPMKRHQCHRPDQRQYHTRKASNKSRSIRRTRAVSNHHDENNQRAHILDLHRPKRIIVFWESDIPNLNGSAKTTTSLIQSERVVESDL